MGEAGFAAHASRSAGEQHRAAPQRDQPARRLPPYEKAAEAADAPEILEQRGGKLAKLGGTPRLAQLIDLLIVKVMNSLTIFWASQ
jgi:hypothetical protein